MTDPWTGATPPPPDSTTEPPPREQSGEQTSTSDAAKGEANKVAQTASDEAGRVANEAKTQVGSVAAEAQTQARDLADQARGQVQEQVGAQQRMVATQLRSVGDELSSMAERGEESGPTTELVRQVSVQARDTASWLEEHEPGDVVEAVRDFARRRPGAFLAGAAVAGLVAGRLTRAGGDNHRDTSSNGSTTNSGAGHLEALAVEPVPVSPGATDAVPVVDPIADPVTDPADLPPQDPSEPLSAPDNRGVR